MTENAYVTYAREAAQRAGIAAADVPIFLAQIEAESGFNPSAKSRAGCIGIAQICDSVSFNPWDPYASLDYAARRMANAYSRYRSWPVALASYNAGDGAVQKYGGVPPYPETQTYVASVLSRARHWGGAAAGAIATLPAIGAAHVGPSPVAADWSHQNKVTVAVVALLVIVFAGVGALHGKA